ncbi:MAG: AAA family ATPase [Clostridiales bacterium]|nr:AAA family ATPase [Clostridiales bacterium]
MTLAENQLNRIIVTGYKSIKECDVSLNKINVLIGSNGAGKSNFISVFSLLQDVLSKNLQISVAQSGVSSLFYDGRKATDEIAFEFFFRNQQNSYGFVLIPTDDNRLIFKKEYFGYYGWWDTQSDIRKNQKRGEDENEASRGASESKWDAGVGNKMDNFVIPILAKHQWQVYHFHDTSRNAKVKQEHNLSNNRVLMHDAGNLAAFLYRLKQNYIKSYEEIVRTVQLIAPYFSDFVLEPQERNNEQIVLKWQQKGCEDVFNASQLSDGTLRFICLATLLLQPKELQPTTIIIDEPELGMHPYAISIFAEMVRQLPEEKQVIISTQSVEMLNEFDVEQIVVVNRGESGSEFKRLNEKELDTWLEDYSLGDLWMKNILGGRLSK